MTYLVIGRVSASARRVWGSEIAQTVRMGPYKRLKRAKKEATKMRKDRILTIKEFEDGWRKGDDGQWICDDRGPWYTDVCIRELTNG